MPATYGDFRDYMDERLASGELVVTPKARELAVRIVLRPPVGPAMRPVVETVNQITIGLLPASIRRQYGLRWDPLRGLAVRGGAEYVRRVVVPLLPPRLRLVRSARAACSAGPAGTDPTVRTGRAADPRQSGDPLSPDWRDRPPQVGRRSRRAA